MRRNLTQVAALFLALLVLPLPLRARALRPARQTLAPQMIPFHPITRFFVDLNGDTRPERVDLRTQGASRTVQVNLASKVTFAVGSGPGFLIPYDIDHDADLDLIWAGSDEKDVVVCINDGQANFSVVSDTSSYEVELDSLFKDHRNSNHRRLKVKRKEKRLGASSISNIAPVIHRFFLATGITLKFQRPQLREPQKLFFRYLQQRGPPVVLSC